MTVALKIVCSNELPEPPYPADTRVKGWKFQFDHERLNQSDTWAIAPADMRPWLLMLWLTAWQQVPAGSMPDDDQIVAAKIGMDYRQFVAHKDILLRGWTPYRDGRIYHPVIVEQVVAYQEFNRKERERVAAWREQKKSERYDGVTRNKHVSTTPEPEPEPEPLKDLVPPDGGTYPTSLSRRSGCPYQQIVDLYHQALPTLPRVVALSANRKAQMRARWEDQLPDIDAWREYFEQVSESRFLLGRVDPPPGRKRFQADLDWLIRESNVLKVYEGKYRG